MSFFFFLNENDGQNNGQNVPAGFVHLFYPATPSRPAQKKQLPVNLDCKERWFFTFYYDLPEWIDLLEIHFHPGFILFNL